METTSLRHMGNIHTRISESVGGAEKHQSVKVAAGDMPQRLPTLTALPEVRGSNPQGDSQPSVLSLGPSSSMQTYMQAEHYVHNKYIF